MEKYVQSLLDRLPDENKKHLLIIMDSAINEMHNNGILSQLPTEIMAKVHDSDPQVRITEKTSIAKSVGHSFIVESTPGSDENGINHNIIVNNNEKFPASIAICIQGGLEGLQMSSIYEMNPSGKMNYNVVINSNNQDTSILVGHIEQLNKLYDEFNINIVDGERIEKLAKALLNITNQKNESSKNSTQKQIPDEVKRKIEKQTKILKILKPIVIQSVVMLPISFLLLFAYDAFKYVFAVELIILISSVIIVKLFKKSLLKPISNKSKSFNGKGKQ